jgi:hypothetical protein
MRSEPMRPDDRAMEQADRLRQNAAYVEQEAHVATLLAVPVEKRDGFAQGRARTAGRNAAIESAALSILGVVEAVPTYPSTANEFEAGWNAHHKRTLDDLGRLRGALVASRLKGYKTLAEPGTLLTDALFVEAIYRLWALIDLAGCEWNAEGGTCSKHPSMSVYPGECDHDSARKYLAKIGLDDMKDTIPNLLKEAQERREHAETLAAELPGEGDAGAAQQ